MKMNMNWTQWVTEWFSEEQIEQMSQEANDLLGIENPDEEKLVDSDDDSDDDSDSSDGDDSDDEDDDNKDEDDKDDKDKGDDSDDGDDDNSDDDSDDGDGSNDTSDKKTSKKDRRAFYKEKARADKLANEIEEMKETNDPKKVQELVDKRVEQGMAKEKMKLMEESERNSFTEKNPDVDMKEVDKLLKAHPTLDLEQAGKLLWVWNDDSEKDSAKSKQVKMKRLWKNWMPRKAKVWVDYSKMTHKEKIDELNRQHKTGELKI